MKDGDTVGVTVSSAELFNSQLSGMEAVRLELSILNLWFHGGRRVGKLFSSTSNRPLGSPHGYAVGERRINLRRALGMKASAGAFTEKELRDMVGKRLCVVVEEVEFQDRMHLRVIDFLPYRKIGRAHV